MLTLTISHLEPRARLPLAAGFILFLASCSGTMGTGGMAGHAGTGGISGDCTCPPDGYGGGGPSAACVVECVDDGDCPSLVCERGRCTTLCTIPPGGGGSGGGFVNPLIRSEQDFSQAECADTYVCVENCDTGRLYCDCLDRSIPCQGYDLDGRCTF